MFVDGFEKTAGAFDMIRSGSKMLRRAPGAMTAPLKNSAGNLSRAVAGKGQVGQSLGNAQVRRAGEDAFQGARSSVLRQSAKNSTNSGTFTSAIEKRQVLNRANTAGNQARVTAENTTKVLSNPAQNRQAVMDRYQRMKPHIDKMKAKDPFYKRHPLLTAGGVFMGARMMSGGSEQPPPQQPQIVQY